MAKEIKQKLTLKPRVGPTDFGRRMDLCWELYKLCKGLKESPKKIGKKIYPK